MAKGKNQGTTANALGALGTLFKKEHKDCRGSFANRITKFLQKNPELVRRALAGESIKTHVPSVGLRTLRCDQGRLCVASANSIYLFNPIDFEVPQAASATPSSASSGSFERAASSQERVTVLVTSMTPLNEGERSYSRAMRDFQHREIRESDHAFYRAALQAALNIYSVAQEKTPTSFQVIDCNQAPWLIRLWNDKGQYYAVGLVSESTTPGARLIPGPLVVYFNETDSQRISNALQVSPTEASCRNVFRP